MANVTLIEEEKFDGQPAWRMTGPDGSTALIAARGATLLSWQPAKGIELIDGYRDSAELAAQDGKRSLVMVPWFGRIAGGAYSFGSHHLGADVDPDLGLHGGKAGAEFVREGAGDALLLRGVLEPSSGHHHKGTFPILSGKLGAIPIAVDKFNSLGGLPREQGCPAGRDERS